MKLLVVDDSAEIVELLSYAVELSGHEADRAYDGIEAVRQLQNNRYDVVITDAEMPGMSGMEVCKLLKSQFPDVYIIGISGAFQALKALKDAGADICLSKPFNIHEVTEIIDNIIHPVLLTYDSSAVIGVHGSA